MVTIVMDYGQQIAWVARYIGQSFFIILSHSNRETIQYTYEKLNFKLK